MYPALKPNQILRNLEKPIIYDFVNNEIFELDDEGFEVVKRLDGTVTLEELSHKLGFDREEIEEFINDLEELDLIEKHPVKSTLTPTIYKKPPFPSLKTILVNTTTACNLRCAHCYLDKSEPTHIEVALFQKLVQQFFNMQGTKLLISGGEPLIHPKIFEMLNGIKEIKIRKILLTNGILIDEQMADQLKDLVQEVQISIDGIQSHDEFRQQKGCFDKSMNAIKLLKQKGFTISVATMVHRKNINEFPKLEELLKKIGVDSWNLDVPSVTGSYQESPKFHLDYKTAGECLARFGFGETYYETSMIHGCGAHLCAVDPHGNVLKCGFFEDKPVGNLKDAPLEDLWRKILKDFIWLQEDLKCKELDCKYLEECKGGCRYRAYLQANDLLDVDRVKCASFGLEIEGDD